MSTSNFKRIMVALVFFYLPFQSNAWGVLGHRIVGQIAETYLTKHARNEIAKILGNESIAMSSNWADFIKSDPAYNYVSNWHYINFEGGLSHEQVQAYLAIDTATDAYTKINFLVAELKNKTLEQDKKAMYLKLLIHIAGDVHQPMHTGRPDDRGGNGIKVTWFGAHLNLHQIWDERLIDFQQLSYTEYACAINFTTKEQVADLQRQPIGEWIYQSYQYAQKIYGDITEPDQKLDYKYNFNYVSILNKQLLEGGVHLAGLLNEIFE